MAAKETPGQLNPQILDAAAAKLVTLMDMEHGGLKGAPKFPQTGLLELLWRGFLRDGNSTYRAAVEIALNGMCQGGMYDHLGGGWARYSVDEFWLVPHFEKMLYDNALLISLLTLAWRTNRNPLYEQRIEETVDWLTREMIVDGGGFAASLDADSEGEEGRFYVWTKNEIDSLLAPEDAALFSTHYDVTPSGNWEGKTIPNRLKQSGSLSADEESALQRIRGQLLAHRAGRVRPGWDDKVLADWNGLMIRALTDAASVFDRPAWHTLASNAFDYVCTQMSYAQNGNARLYHSCRLGNAQHSATSDDYANMAQAALALYETTGDAIYLQKAETWVDTLNSHYWAGDLGGYFLTADDAEALIVRTRTADDDATPAANGTMVDVLTRLSLLTGNSSYAVRADTILHAYGGAVQQNFFQLGTLLNNFEFYSNPTQIVIRGRRDDPRTQALARTAKLAPGANHLLAVVDESVALPADHPAAGTTLQDGHPAAYVCVGRSCSLPCTDEQALGRILTGPASIQS